MQITRDIVNYVAELSRIRLTDEQAQKMETELGAVIDYMDVLNTLDTEGVEPLSHVFDVVNVMREDEVAPSFERAQILENAPEHTEETFIVPKTVE